MKPDRLRSPAMLVPAGTGAITPPPASANGAGGVPNPEPVRTEFATVVCVLRPFEYPRLHQRSSRSRCRPEPAAVVVHMQAPPYRQRMPPAPPSPTRPALRFRETAFSFEPPDESPFVES